MHFVLSKFNVKVPDCFYLNHKEFNRNIKLTYSIFVKSHPIRSDLAASENMCNMFVCPHRQNYYDTVINMKYI